MNTQGTHYEILLFTGTSLASRQFTSMEENRSKAPLAIEELEKACWNGILYEVFPELLGNFTAKCESFIWHIMAGRNFLNISMGSHPSVIENDASIDPYFFLNDAANN